jgi:hypothetical protein
VTKAWWNILGAPCSDHTSSFHLKLDTYILQNPPPIINKIIAVKTLILQLKTSEAQVFEIKMSWMNYYIVWRKELDRVTVFLVRTLSDATVCLLTEWILKVLISIFFCRRFLVGWSEVGVSIEKRTFARKMIVKIIRFSCIACLRFSLSTSSYTFVYEATTWRLENETKCF